MNTGTETIYNCSEKPSIQGLQLMVRGRRRREKARCQRSQRIATVHGRRRITKGQTVTYTLSDGKKIQKVTEVVTGTESVVRAVSFLHR
jgi:hypothetical protein